MKEKRRFDNQFEIIEEKLRNSFKNIKKDIDSLKTKETKPLANEPEVKKEEINAIESKLDQFTSDIKLEIENLKKEVNRKNLKESITESVGKNVEVKFQELTQKLNEAETSLRSSVREYELKSSEEKNQVVEQTQKELVELRENIAKASEENLEKVAYRDAQINNLQRQIAYLKGRFKKLSPETKEEKKEIKQIEKEYPDFINYTAIIRNIIIAIVLIAIGYAVATNLVASHTYEYNYDIGSSQDGRNPYIFPEDDLSDVFKQGSVTYRNLTANTVFFNAPIPDRPSNMTVELRILNNLPLNSTIFIGAQKDSSSNYEYHSVYNETEISLYPKGDWVTLRTSFELANLSISNGNLLMTVKVNTLNRSEGYQLSIDEINLEVHKKRAY